MKMAIGALGVLASILAMSALLPQLNVAPGPTANPREAFGTLFALTNNGTFSINDVHFDFKLNDFYNPTQNQRIQSEFRPWPYQMGDLAAGDSIGLPFEKQLLGFPDATADVTIAITFRPSFWPFRRRRQFRFITIRSTDGTWVWKRRALTDEDRKLPYLMD